MTNTTPRRDSQSIRSFARAVLLVGVVFAGAWTAFLLTWHPAQKSYSQPVLSESAHRNQKMLASLKDHPTKVLVGNYQRLDQLTSAGFKIVPVEGCTEIRPKTPDASSSAAFEESSFAYLLTLDAVPTPSAACTIDKVIAAYGKPNETVVVAGSLDQPKEMLLYYDSGSNLTALQSTPATISKLTTVYPISLSQLPHTTCATASTSLNIVAHEDDDLLFLSPDVLKNVQAGRCVRTIYITAGDAGQNELYWLRRERATEAAYDVMTKNDKIWIQRTVKLADHQYITVVNPKGNPNISLIFMHLPDGQPNGQGFRATGNESLARLAHGSIKVIHSVDGQSSYTEAQLLVTISTLLNTYQPNVILTQTPYNAGRKYPDHSDHIAVGQLTQQASRDYITHHEAVTVHYYTGYPIHEKPANVFGADYRDKAAAYFAYAQFDDAVCKTAASCEKSTLGLYLAREYTAPPKP